MPATKISDYAVGQNKWDELLTTIEKQRKGFIALSLTNYDNNSEPAIAAGSYVEISGALYGFTSEEAINGTPSSGDTNYIYIDTSDLKPYWTTTAPTWSADKNGWYDSTETDRYIGGCYYDGTNYTGKWVYTSIQGLDNRFLDETQLFVNRVSSNQSIEHNTDTKVQLNNIIYDRNNEYSTSNYRWICSHDGYYLIIGQVRIGMLYDQKHIYVEIAINGDLVVYKKSICSCDSGTSVPVDANVVYSGYLESGDYVELYAWQGNGDTRSIICDNSIHHTYMQITELQRGK